MKMRIALMAAGVLATSLAMGARAEDTTAPATPQTAAQKHAAYCKEHKDECAKQAAARHARYCKKHPEKCNKAAAAKDESKKDEATPPKQ
jgi:predicted transglutaminase-like cysteine proteinase